MSGSRTAARVAAYGNSLLRRPRLLIAAAAGIVGYFLAPWSMREATRALIGWNIGACVFLGMVAYMMAKSPGEGIRDHAEDEDENTSVLLLIAVVAALAAIAAIVAELGPVKDMQGVIKVAHLALVAVTIFTAWAFTHLMFALHYAAEYYASDGSEHGVRGGFVFPQSDRPGWSEFCYEAFVIGCACATADVNLTSRDARVDCLIQGVVAFFFNTIILALTINIAAGLI